LRRHRRRRFRRSVRSLCLVVGKRQVLLKLLRSSATNVRLAPVRLDLVLVDAGRLRLVPCAVDDVRTALADLVDLRQANRKLALALKLEAAVGEALALDGRTRAAK